MKLSPALSLLSLVLLTALLLPACDFGSEKACSEADPCAAGFDCVDGRCLQSLDGDALDVAIDTDATAADTTQDSDATADPDTADLDTTEPSDTTEPDTPDTAVDPCNGITCSGHGMCVAAAGAATCDCDAGYMDDGAGGCVAEGPAPVAALSLSASQATVQDNVQVDASGSTGSNLEYRFDYENDGIFDTSWLTTATLSHRWCAPASYGVSVEVRDGAGRVAQASAAIEVTWYGAPGWVGIGNNTQTEYAWWTVTDLTGIITSDSELHATGDTYSYTRARMARQASDSRVLVALECKSELTCLGNEIAVVGVGGKSGSLGQFTLDVDPWDALELPGGNWLVSSRTSNAIIELDVNGTPIDYWADNLAGPTGMALSPDGTQVLVAMTDGARIDAFALDGQLAGRWDAVGHLSSPETLRRARSGRYMVADLAGGIFEFEADGSYSGELLSSADVAVPRGLAELSDTELLFGEDCTTSEDACGNVRLYDRTTGNHSLFAPQGSTSSVIYNPYGLAVVYQ